MVRLSGVFALCVLASSAHDAVAQDRPDAAAERLAREETHRGFAAARADRWEEARTAFEHAYAISKKPGALFSLAGAQAKTGQLVEAAESYRTIAKLDRDVGEDQKKAARDALAALEPRLAHVRIVIHRGAQEGDVVSLDSKPLAPAVLSLDLPANPGSHEVSMTRKGSHAPPVTFTLVESESRTVTLVPTLDPVPPSTRAEPPPPQEKRSIFRSPWFWTIAGVVVAGATVGTICATGACSSSDTSRQPYQGTLGTAAFP